MSKVRIILVTLVATMLGATEALSQQTEAGRLNVSFSSVQLDTLMRATKQSNATLQTLEGYRVQIYSGSGVASKSEAMAAQTRFQTLYPQERAYVVYNAPFWRVRVGDFRFRDEALRLLNSIKTTFPGSYMVRDNTIRKKNFRE